MLDSTEQRVLLDRDELLQTMSFVAYMEAQNRLSNEGEEMLRMLAATESTDLDIVEAYRESAAFDALAPDDQTAIEVWLARETLIDEFKTFEG
jgi:hypothetical protein